MKKFLFNTNTFNIFFVFLVGKVWIHSIFQSKAFVISPVDISDDKKPDSHKGGQQIVKLQIIYNSYVLCCIRAIQIICDTQGGDMFQRSLFREIRTLVA